MTTFEWRQDGKVEEWFMLYRDGKEIEWIEIESNDEAYPLDEGESQEGYTIVTHNSESGAVDADDYFTNYTKAVKFVRKLMRENPQGLWNHD